jgi:hypothetical protein
MNEEAWLAATDLNDVIEPFRYAKGKERQFRLFAVQCVLAVQPHLNDERCIRAFEFAEANAERRSFKRLRWRPQVQAAAIEAETEAETARQRGEQDEYCHPDVWNKLVVVSSAASAARALLDNNALLSAFLCAHCAENVVSFASTEPFDARGPFRRLAIAWFRDIFGNLFHPVSFSASWRTQTAVQLSQSMYDSRDFSAMPILADALQDAGCDNDDILNHCRDANGIHVRGCWVVDLVLGKE